MIEALSASSLLSILPPSILRDEKIYATAKALDAELAKLTAATVETLHIARLDELPENVIDILGWQWHVENYDLALPLTKKRELVKTSIRVHRYKGTLFAVKTAVASIFSEPEISEWFNFDGEPYTFKLKLPGFEGFSPEKDIAVLANVVRDTKNVRSHMGEITLHREITREENDPLYFALLKSRSGRADIATALPANGENNIFAATAHMITGEHKLPFTVETETANHVAAFTAVCVNGRKDIAASTDDMQRASIFDPPRITATFGSVTERGGVVGIQTANHTPGKTHLSAAVIAAKDGTKNICCGAATRGNLQNFFGGVVCRDGVRVIGANKETFTRRPRPHVGIMHVGRAI